MSHSFACSPLVRLRLDNGGALERISIGLNCCATLRLWAPGAALLGPDSNGPRNRILDEMARRFERQHRRKTGASAIDPALDRAHGAITQRSRFTVRKSVGAYEKNCLPHLIRQPAERLAEFLAFRPAGLLRRDHQGFRVYSVAVLPLSSPAAFFGIECVAKNGYEPRLQVAAGFESAPVDERAQQRVLDEVVRTIDIARKRKGECTKLRNCRERSGPKGSFGFTRYRLCL